MHMVLKVLTTALLLQAGSAFTLYLISPGKPKTIKTVFIIVSN